MDFFAENATYQDPRQDLVGREALAQRFHGEARPERSELRITNIAENGDVVLVEHALIQEFAQFRVEVAAMSAFDLHEGKITRWALYVDLGEIARQAGSPGDW